MLISAAIENMNANNKPNPGLKKKNYPGFTLLKVKKNTIFFSYKNKSQ